MATRRRRIRTPKIPDHAIDALFGHGYNATRWQMELELQGFIWYPGLKNRIIGRQFLFFKEEIGQLLSGPPRRRADGTISNSCKSILQVLRGQTGEASQRLRDGRLFGPDSSNRTLEDKVKTWREVDPSYGFPSEPNHAALLDVSAGGIFAVDENTQETQRSDYDQMGHVGICSRQNDTNHNVPWTAQPMPNGTLLITPTELGHHKITNRSILSTPDGFHHAVDYPSTQQQLLVQGHSPAWDHGSSMMNSASDFALENNETTSHDPYLSEPGMLQADFKTHRAACPKGYASSTLSQSNQSSHSELRDQTELWVQLSAELPPQYSNTSTSSAETAVLCMQDPPEIGITQEIAGQLISDQPTNFLGVETESFDDDHSEDYLTVLADQCTEMANFNGFQPSSNDEMNSGRALEFTEFLRRIAPNSRLSFLAKQTAQAARTKRNRTRHRVFRETRLRRRALNLSSKLQRLEKDLNVQTTALKQKDAEVLNLTGRTQHLDLLEFHRSEKSRQEAGLAKQKDPAKKANSDPPFDQSTEYDNENPPKRLRVMQSSGLRALTLNGSGPASSTPRPSRFR